MFFNVEFEIVVAETGDVMKERIEVYETIRNELIVIEELQRNVWIYMYVLFCTLFVLGLEWSHFLFLVSYIVLIPFQCVINDYQWSISKMSIYIRVFLKMITEILVGNHYMYVIYIKNIINKKRKV